MKKVFLGMILVSLYVLNVSAKTIKKEAQVIVGNELVSLVIQANKKITGNPDIVHLEHLRVNFNGTKYPLFGSTYKWCNFFGYKYLSYSLIGRVEQDYQGLDEGLMFTKDGELRLSSAGNEMHVNFIDCTNNSNYEY